MRDEVIDWVADTVKRTKPKAPVLEVGALDVNGSVRDLFPQEGYVGLDMRDGNGVDLVGNIHDEPPPDMAGAFNTAVCCETLEHVADPRLALARMHQYLRPGGVFIGTWCFVFSIHEEPDDYWRATPAGFRLLLEAAGFSDIEIETEGAGPVGVFATARRAG